MKGNYIFLTILYLLSLPFIADGTEERREYISPELLANEALNRNQRLISLKQRIESQKYIEESADKLMDTRFKFDLQRIPALRPYDLMGVDMYMFSLEQEIPYPTKLRTKREIEHLGTERLRRLYENEALNIEVALYNYFYKYHSLYYQKEILNSKKGLIESLIEIARKRYASSLMMQADILKMESMLLMINNEIELLNSEIATVGYEINYLLSRDIYTPLPPPQDYEIEKIEIKKDDLQSLIKSSPELLTLKVEVEKSEKISLYAKQKTYLPDFMIGGGYQLSPMMQDGFFLMLSINLPWLNSKNKDEYNATQKMYLEKKSIYQNEYKMAEAEVFSIYDRLVKLSSTIANIEKILSLNKEKLDVERSMYEKNIGSYINLIDAINDLYDTSIKYIKMKSEYAMAYTDLLRGCGLSIKTTKGGLKWKR